MQIRNYIIGACICLFFVQGAFGQQVSEWRGPGRTGVYPDTNLLKTWPEEGPAMKWVLEDIPDGYSSLSVMDETLFLTGLEDSLDVLVAVGLDGTLKWKTAYGRYWEDSFSPSRATPTVEGGRVYVSSGMGDLACVDAVNGDILWSVQASEKYKGSYGKWGISESLLVFEGMVFFTPGGNATTMIALDKMTGDLIWQSESIHDNPAYVSPLLIDWADTLMVVNVTENYVIGVDPYSGDLRWKFNYGQFAGGAWRANIQANTPLYRDGQLFVTNGYDHTTVMIELSEKGNAAYFLWADTTLDVHHGGVVRIGDYIYGASWIGNRNGNWVCLDWNSGEVMYNDEWENKGSIISADGMLYCYDEKGGNVALAEASPEGFDPVSTFKVPYGKGPHWAHMVIHQQVLYIRHGKALMAYDIAAAER